MTEKLDPKQVVSVEEALRMEMIINQALIDILISKGILTHDELMKQVEEIKGEMGESDDGLSICAT